MPLMKLLLLSVTMLTIPFLGISQHTPKQPKAIGLTISLPWVNNYSYYNHHSQNTTSKSGFVGFGASAYFETGEKKFSVNLGFTGDLPAPIGAFDYAKEGTRSNILSTFVEGIYHKKLVGKLNIIAGVNHIRYRYKFTSYVNTLPSYSIFDNTLGFTIGSEYRFSRKSSIALLYRPAIISLNQKSYRHLISLDTRFDIKFWKRE